MGEHYEGAELLCSLGPHDELGMSGRILGDVLQVPVAGRVDVGRADDRRQRVFELHPLGPAYAQVPRFLEDLPRRQPQQRLDVTFDHHHDVRRDAVLEGEPAAACPHGRRCPTRLQADDQHNR